MGEDIKIREDDVDSERLWLELDKISAGLSELAGTVSSLARSFATYQENVDGRLNRIDEKYDEIKNDQDHARESRAKAFDRIDKLSDDTREQFHQFEHRIDEIETAPAKKALARDEENASIIRSEVIKRLVNFGIGLVLIMVFFFGSRLILKDFAAVLPKSSIEEVLP